MKTFRNTQTGLSAASYVTLVAVLTVLTTLVFAFFVNKQSPVEIQDADQKITLNATSSNGTSSNARNNYQKATVVDASQTGPYYHNRAFGLTVPGIYEVQTNTKYAYGNVEPTASYNFYYTGVKLFTINVFSKEEWNNIRIQETKQADAGVNNAYLGEGHYLGENKTWIYSFEPSTYSVPPTGILFY